MRPADRDRPVPAREFRKRIGVGLLRNPKRCRVYALRRIGRNGLRVHEEIRVGRNMRPILFPENHDSLAAQSFENRTPGVITPDHLVTCPALERRICAETDTADAGAVDLQGEDGRKEYTPARHAVP